MGQYAEIQQLDRMEAEAEERARRARKPSENTAIEIRAAQSRLEQKRRDITAIEETIQKLEKRQGHQLAIENER